MQVMAVMWSHLKSQPRISSAGSPRLLGSARTCCATWCVFAPRETLLSHLCASLSSLPGSHCRLSGSIQRQRGEEAEEEEEEEAEEEEGTYTHSAGCRV